jgi:GT2 family glycosyltransferase
VLVWDNASTDDSLDVISKCGDAVHVIESTENVGFAKGNNSAARRASGELLVFLNPDTYLPEPDTLSRFVGPLGRPQIGLVGPMLHNADGSLQKSVSGFPSLSRAIVVAFGLHRLLSDRAQARFAPVSWSQTWSREVDWVKGAALACRAAEFWEIGGFPEDTFMYGEDAELAYRFHDHGLAVFYTVDTAIFHLGDHSSKKCWTNEETAERTARAAVLFLRQRHSRFQATAIRTFWTIGYALRAILWHRSNPEGARVYAAMCRATAARPAMQKT